MNQINFSDLTGYGFDFELCHFYLVGLLRPLFHYQGKNCMQEKINELLAIPTRSQVSAANQILFDKLHRRVGFVPNLYAFLGRHDHALTDYINFKSRTTVLTVMESEVVKLVTSQHHDSLYCLSAHVSHMVFTGLTEETVNAIRAKLSSGDERLDVLANFTRELLATNGAASEQALEQFIAAGFDHTHLADVILAIGETVISNFLFRMLRPEIDFPIADEIEQ